MNLRVFTPWGAVFQPEVNGDVSKVSPLELAWSDAARHCLFQSWALQLLREHFPGLLEILEENGGKVVVWEGAFYVAASASSEDWIEIPTMSQLLRLVPWREIGEAVQ